MIREAGSAWTDGGAFDQPEVNDHAAFMDALASDGLVHFVGPLAGSEHGRIRAWSSRMPRARWISIDG